MAKVYETIFGEVLGAMLAAGTLLVDPAVDPLLGGEVETARGYYLAAAERGGWAEAEARERARLYVLTATQRASRKARGEDCCPQL